MDEMSRIHERNPLGFGGIGHSQKRSVADERFFDEDMFARRYRRECSLFLRSRRNTNVDGVNVRTVQQVIETFYCRNTLAFGYKSLRVSIWRLETAISLPFVDLSIASAMMPAIIPVPTMPNQS
jgi:hypothetical protein